MKNIIKYFFLLILLVNLKSYSQTYTPLNYFFNGTPTHGIKIKTNIPFQNGVGMPTVMLEGFEYNGGNVIDIKLNWYVLNNIFYRANASSSGSYTPEIKLANDNGKVSIYINDKKYYTRFSIRVYSFGKSETASMFDGWTAVDEPISGTNIKTVAVKNAFEGNITVSGKVGIGTTNPSAVLHVERAIPVNFIANLKNTDTGVSSNGLRVEVSNASSNNTVQRWLVNNNEIMRVRADGNVGIGTISPGSKLSVNGNIHTKEVKVDLIGWSDFVFKEDYNLPTLKEVEQYIKERGHLKDIPSAEEVKENGIFLGDMDSKLLQKIEELTLYTINQEKRIENLESKIKELLKAKKQ